MAEPAHRSPHHAQAAGTTGRTFTADDAFRLAKSTFMRGEKVEMQPLAAALGIDRSTLFRWVGNRDVLLANICWSLLAPTLRWAENEVRQSTPHAPPQRLIATTIDVTIRAVITTDYFSDYLVRERERAMRVLTTTATDFQHRLVAYIEELIGKYLSADELELTPNELSYLLVRVMESFIYTDTITGERPEPSRGTASIGVLLKGAVRATPAPSA